ncbi:nicotinate-nucleotide adenylyltransferase [Granulicella sp. L60]|uniref:nicotinate-nucleotide adenylyltransferase n=1 Tax=Granulicella sp. L60 TaxID=1641866 RepID=UPI00131DC612|nr:nicotinate-nucleotide adenylyltransferase [Granulicella sp. L60]
MRVTLFGGTFDPPHLGHIAIATAAANAFHLDTVLFTPAGRQPLKPDGAMAPFADRLAMVQLACASDARFTVSTLDAPHPDGTPNYTVDTLAALRQQMPEARLFNLVGADSFLGMPRWHQSERLLELAEWIVVSRPGFSLDSLDDLHLTPSQLSRVRMLETIHEDVASTDLRQRLEAGDPCDDLLPAAISQYIHIHRLYRPPSHPERSE